MSKGINYILWVRIDESVQRICINNTWIQIHQHRKNDTLNILNNVPMYIYIAKRTKTHTWQIICSIRHIHIRELLLNKKSLHDNFEKKNK